MDKFTRPIAGCTFANAKNPRLQYDKDLQVDVSLESGFEQHILPINGVNNDGPFEFQCEPIRDTLLAMDKMDLIVQAEVVDGTGQRLSYQSNVCPINYLLSTMWKSIECRVNGHPINLSASQHTAYKSLMQAYVTVDRHASEYLTPSLYTPESSKDSCTSLLPGYNRSTSDRRKFVNLGGGEFQMCGPVSGVDFLLSDTYLAPLNKLSLTFNRHDDQFIFNTPKVDTPSSEDYTEAYKAEHPNKAADEKLLKEYLDANKKNDELGKPLTNLLEIEELKKKMQQDKQDAQAAAIAKLSDDPQLTPRLIIKDIALSVRRIQMTRSALQDYFRPSELQRYHGALTEVHSHALVTGITKKNISVYSGGVLPKQVVIGMVLTNSFVGDYHANPFDFQSFGLNKIALKVNAVRVPQEPMQPDFDKKHIMREYVHLLKNTGKWRTDSGNSIAPYNFERGITLFPFDLTPDMCASYHTHAGKEGVVEVELGWKEPLKEQVTVVIFTCKDQIVTIDPTAGGLPATNAF